MFEVKKCHLCGKEICRRNWEDYHYRYGVKYFCSWNCYRKYIREDWINEIEEDEYEEI